MYQYQVDCWVPPKSGFDLAKKTEFVSVIESIFDSMKSEFPEEIEELRDSLNKFLEEGEGYILDTIIVETESPIKSIDDCKQRFMSLIQQKNPYAKLVGCTIIPAE